MSYYLSSECGKKVNAKDWRGACDVAQQIAKIGRYFLDATKDQHLTAEQAQQCINGARDFLTSAAAEVGRIKFESPDRSVTADLDYCLEFMPDRNRQSLEKMLQ